MKGGFQESVLSGVFSQAELKQRYPQTIEELKHVSLFKSLHFLCGKVLALIVKNTHGSQEPASWLKEFPRTLGESIRPEAGVCQEHT